MITDILLQMTMDIKTFRAFLLSTFPGVGASAMCPRFDFQLTPERENCIPCIITSLQVTYRPQDDILYADVTLTLQQTSK